MGSAASRDQCRGGPCYLQLLLTKFACAAVLQQQENDAWAALLAEISAEAGQVAQFLIDREIEAPERYSAVQSYRVAMAVLRQQRLFVEVSALC